MRHSGRLVSARLSTNTHTRSCFLGSKWLRLFGDLELFGWVELKKLGLYPDHFRPWLRRTSQWAWPDLLCLLSEGRFWWNLCEVCSGPLHVKGLSPEENNLSLQWPLNHLSRANDKTWQVRFYWKHRLDEGEKAGCGCLMPRMYFFPLRISKTYRSSHSSKTHSFRSFFPQPTSKQVSLGM